MVTTNVTTTQPPVLTAPRCEDTGLWKIQLEPNTQSDTTDDKTPTTPPDALNAVFDLPSSRHTLLWQHAALGFPPKETLIAAVQAGNLSTWPGLTITTVRHLFPDSTETAKGHLKGQQQGICSTRQKALEKLVETQIKQEKDESPPTDII